MSKSAEPPDVLPPQEHRDAIGRRRLCAQRREEPVRELQSGRLTAAAFARKHELCYTTLVSWLRRAGVVDCAKSRASSSSTTQMTQTPQVAFRELRIDAAPPATGSPLVAGLAVVIPGGIEVRCGDVATVVGLIRALREAR